MQTGLCPSTQHYWRRWDDDSEAALRSLLPDVAVFVGDFGEEDVALVARIAAIPQRKVVILGNHDAW